MKIKYLRLSKDEKKNIKKDFLETKKGSIINKHLRNSKICAILCFAYAIFLIVEYIIEKNSIFNIISALLLIAFGIFCFIYSHRIFVKSVNDYLVNKKS